jgi:subtilisin family serine protease
MEVDHTPYYMAIDSHKRHNMLWMTSEPLNNKDCLNFFNESWVCFTDNVKAHLYVNMTIEPNSDVTLYNCDFQVPWHLHSISHLDKLPVDASQYAYGYNRQNPNTPVYILDTWIDSSHPEFEGRARIGAVFTSGSGNNGHGTHVAGLIGSKSFGVNKRAQMIGVQVLDDNGFGSWQTILAGMQWVSTQPMGIVSMSIGGSKSDIVNKLVRSMTRRGWKFVVAAGNDNRDACQYSPASATEAITVGAIESSYTLSGFSNYGPCVDIMAPGGGILSTWPRGLYAYMSGTSMATPIVSGIWSLYPEWTVKDLLRQSNLKTLNPLPAGTPSRLAYSPDTGGLC